MAGLACRASRADNPDNALRLARTTSVTEPAPSSRFPQSRVADHAQSASAATARVPVVAIGWKPKGIARPQELLLINRADLERSYDTQDELLGPDLVRPRPVIARDR